MKQHGICGFTHFIIPFKADSDRKELSEIILSDGFSPVSCPDPTEIHDYIIDRYFSDEAVSACRVFRKNTETRFCDKFLCTDEVTREIVFSSLTLYIYDHGIHFAVFCADYSRAFSLDDMLISNSGLRFLSTNDPSRFTESAEGFTESNSSDGIMLRLLRRLIPDIRPITKKAVICSYAVCSEDIMSDEGRRDSLLFHLATGSGPNHIYNEQMTFAKYIQSADIVQGLSREGISRLVLDSDAPSYNLLDNPYSIVNSYHNNYLWIYLILLCQYYGFKDFNNTALDLYTQSLRKKPFVRRRIQRLKEQSELFYLQNVYTDISQITYQNDIYRMLSDIYSIAPLIDEFNNDMNICSSYAEKKNMNIKMLIIAVSTIIAAVSEILGLLNDAADAFDLFNRFFGGK